MSNLKRTRSAQKTDTPSDVNKEKAKSETKTLTTLLGPEAKNAWAKPGFRLRAGYASEYRVGQHLAPTHWAHGLTLEPVYQFDSDWALSVQLNYTVNAAAGEFNGLMWHTFFNTDVRLIQHLRLSFGVGIAGIFKNPLKQKQIKTPRWKKKRLRLVLV